MDNNNNYKIKAIPFIIKEIRDGKIVGKRYSMTNKETKEMSCDPRILWNHHGSVYFAELPLMYHEEGKISDSLFYIYDELTEEEKEKYKDLVVEVPVTIPGIVKINKTKENKKKRRIRKKESPQK